jgi:hypothetical protein
LFPDPVGINGASPQDFFDVFFVACGDVGIIDLSFEVKLMSGGI